MNFTADSVEKYIDAYLAGAPLEAPREMQEQYGYAVAAHDVLRDFLDETLDASDLELVARRPPSISSDYEIERELGAGGMGVVYLARQKSLHRQVAIKVLRPGKRTQEVLVQRFLEEAKHLAKLRHPNIVSVHEIGDAGGEPYFTMDYIEGEPLSAMLARAALTPSRAVEILRQVALAVQHAHRQGVIHRDLKPANVLLDRQGQVFVTDFGLARSVGEDSSLTQPGEVLGTPQYMSPEQARGQTSLVGEATDIHALGLLLFEMLTGRPAFSAANSMGVLLKLVNEEAPLLRTIDRRIPRDLETICLKCLQKSPAARYANVNALLVDLARYEQGEPLVARRPGPLYYLSKWTRQHWKIAAAVLVTAALAAGVAPLMMEKPYQELVSWGDEELVQGNASTAATVYARALRRATPQEKKELTPRIVQTCRSLGATKESLDLAMQVIPQTPEASFGKLDFLIAQALVTRQRSNPKQGGLNIWVGAPIAELELAKKRLALALEQPLTAEQKLDLEESFAAVALALNMAAEGGSPHVRVTPDTLAALPQATEEELARQRDDEKAHPWNRGRAAMALGRLFVKQGKNDAARAEYEAALNWMKSVYPMLGGVKAGQMRSGVMPDAEECRLMQRLVDDLKSLAPEAPVLSAGRVEFEVQGFELPERMAVSIDLALWDASIKNPDAGLSQNLPRLVPLRQGAPVSVRVLDGTYRLRTQTHSISYDSTTQQRAKRLQIDIEGWPEEIEVRGGVVQLPPVVLRLAEAVNLDLPETGEAIDLKTAELKWSSIPNADHYKVQLMYRTEGATVTTYMIGNVACSKPSLRFSELEGLDRTMVVKDLKQGRTGGWRVSAYDAKGKCVGVGMEERWFLIAGELEAK